MEQTTIEITECYMQFCDGECQTVTPQTCEDKGLDEQYTCTVCGAVHFVRVR